jgi:polar amino acid transport system substrate-binding protein
MVLTTWSSPPYSNPQQNGYFDLLLKEAFSRLDINITIENRPAERSLKDANNGVTDGDFFRVSEIGLSYPNLLIVPEPLYEMEFVAFSKMKNLTLPNSWSSLSDYNTGYVIGWKIIEENIGDMYGNSAVGSQEILFKLLAANRIEVAIYSRHFGRELINKFALKNIYMAHQPLAVKPMYLFLHKRHGAIIPQLTNILKEMKTESHLVQLEQK